MPPTEQLASALRHRKSGVVRKLESEIQLLHTDHRKTAKQRWSTCFAFIFKRAKLKSTDHFVPSSFYPSSTSSSSSSSSYSSSSSASSSTTTYLRTCNNTVLDIHHKENVNDSNANSMALGRWSGQDSLNASVILTSGPVVEKPTYQAATSLPPTPTSSLSPPPRKHIITRQCKTQRSTPLAFSPTTTYDSTTTHVPHINAPPVQRRHHIPRSSVLRLSLDVDQRYSYTSSIYSSDSCCAATAVDPIDGNDNDSLSYPTPEISASTSMIEKRLQRQQRCSSWASDLPKRATSCKLHLDHNDDDDEYAGCQISKDKAHYDAVVAASTLYRHTKPTSLFSLNPPSLSPPPQSAVDVD